ncbi:tRNA pseudouridine(55) synthase TruB [Intestinimonas massiliensis (ex Afouda et al. 2020)]|uniref:tRNA pseudouridine(55) synthase TruB n=1 Tax=Intestinimonas massiliensis (ex Afouda et al. 2020) TaxID=1673721 RepID=UPI0010310574|nr:tRNA pseudouridine(55) synthase TruB [Intestinimonas massiliensis (ex Afouda et al. 2020)]
MANGVLIIDKPSDWTSMDVCAKLRGILREKRIGHGGTLDPMATGVLPVFVGRATRAVEFAVEGQKEYLAALQLGVITNTQDATGEVTETRPVDVDRAALEKVLDGFRGEISQIPPMYSAIKIQGKKLYQLARAGQEVERAPRQVTIHGLEILDGAPAGFPTGENLWYLRVTCSKGTYVRTLCHDIGEALGCGGSLSALRRTRVGDYTLDGAVTLEQVQAADDPAALLMPVDSCFAGLPMLVLKSPQAEKKIRNGMAVTLPAAPGDGTYRLYGMDRTFLALSRVEGNRLTTIKSFFEV